MTEPEDTLTKHGIKRVFVVLLILRILWEVSGVVATTTQAETAQNTRSDVEYKKKCINNIFFESGFNFFNLIIYRTHN